MKKFLFSLSIVLLVGCVQVPMTTIKVPTANGLVTIKAPKDSKIAGLKANFEKGTVSLDSYEARMNPDVVSASAAGQAELIKAYSEMANSLGQLGIRAFAASQGIPLGSSAPQQPSSGRSVTQAEFDALVRQQAEAFVKAQAAAAATNPPPTASTNAPAK